MMIHDDIMNVSKYVENKSVDLIIYDPPYGIGNNKLTHKEKNWNKSSEEWDSFDSIDAQYAFYQSTLKLLSPLLTNTGSIFVFGSFHNIFLIGEIIQRQMGWKIINSICWEKVNAMFSVTRSSLIEGTEYIIWCAPASGYNFNYEKSKVNEKQLRNVWKSSSTPQSERVGLGHPHQKPRWLFQRFIEIALLDGGTVLDPMSGSGTTGEVCAANHIKYVCIEKDKRYFDMGQRRVSQVIPSILY
jgi:site-specific DNA-methyltransferase (adenine-specific)